MDSLDPNFCTGYVKTFSTRVSPPNMNGWFHQSVAGQPRYEIDVEWDRVPDMFVEHVTRHMRRFSTQLPERVIMMTETQFKAEVQKAAIALIIEEESGCKSKAEFFQQK